MSHGSVFRSCCVVLQVVVALALYPDRQEFRRQYPDIDDEDVRQALAYAAANLYDASFDQPAVN
jgi:uncharacterized protein (DUF433 family)